MQITITHKEDNEKTFESAVRITLDYIMGQKDFKGVHIHNLPDGVIISSTTEKTHKEFMPESKDHMKEFMNTELGEPYIAPPIEDDDFEIADGEITKDGGIPQAFIHGLTHKIKMYDKSKLYVDEWYRFVDRLLMHRFNQVITYIRDENKGGFTIPTADDINRRVFEGLNAGLDQYLEAKKDRKLDTITDKTLLVLAERIRINILNHYSNLTVCSQDSWKFIEKIIIDSIRENVPISRDDSDNKVITGLTKADIKHLPRYQPRIDDALALSKADMSIEPKGDYLSYQAVMNQCDSGPVSTPALSMDQCEDLGRIVMNDIVKSVNAGKLMSQEEEVQSSIDTIKGYIADLVRTDKEVN